MNVAEEIAKWQQTGNPSHATDILHQLSKVLVDSKYQNIERDHDVTVGKGSGGEIKSGLLWAVIDSHEAKNRLLHQQIDELLKQLEGVS